ncbi:biotin-dependent carboxyltransferase family protein [Polymorphobacter fuscus]|uniref:Allophanate hydrolase n=1 Tax=Sandarakinorhabdus fusca TaxID=1439888 RepID=A0A7C9GNM3_9SPHN|nr:biotin-dependent carboxyltransferase family protein [Polymorphobacter fuscus]KAB7647603.1 biotin-dependent carboxyltransferase family protein [Polymorphobacter fuscus]MQT16875.1 allophanate hydrolase [Polymorphobacter fuscus]NJC09136.1 allophanate hydrolase [Polymorphobacter fuscus]
MTSAVLLVEQAGPLTTIQDAGRFGHLRHGVSWSGPVEPLGFAAARTAIASRGAAIELSHGGIALRCVEGAVTFALAGGDFTATIDGAPLGGWTTGVLTAGARLVVRDGAAGNWATLALGGVPNCPAWLGSSATLALAGLGGGRLVVGDRLTVDADPIGDAVARPFAPPPAETGPIRVVLGPQLDAFAPETVAALTGADFTAAPAFDRMGMVLTGPPLVPLALTMLSSPTIRGAIQVNGAGTATILLADHQTTGGYPRIATVISADLPRAAQLRPGQPLRFVAISAAEAVAIARAAALRRTEWLKRVATADTLLDRLLAANLIDGVVDAREE